MIKRAKTSKTHQGQDDMCYVCIHSINGVLFPAQPCSGVSSISFMIYSFAASPYCKTYKTICYQVRATHVHVCQWQKPLYVFILTLMSLGSMLNAIGDLSLIVRQCHKGNARCTTSLLVKQPANSGFSQFFKIEETELQNPYFSRVFSSFGGILSSFSESTLMFEPASILNGVIRPPNFGTRANFWHDENFVNFANHNRFNQPSLIFWAVIHQKCTSGLVASLKFTPISGFQNIECRPLIGW